MTQPLHISVDAMGGDHGPGVVLAACKAALASDLDLTITVVGPSDALQRELGRRFERLHLRDATEVVTMDDAPADAVRRKKDSSMRVAINMVAAGETSACVSAGNTGALMATAKFVLKTRPEIDRPAIVAEIPARTNRVFMLDLGANANCSAEQLQQFAWLGADVAAAITGQARPRVALLNIGEEEAKGNDVVRDAAALLSEDALVNYVGFVEGNRLFDNVADVVVTDGFSGNVALKAMEGTAALIGDYLRAEFEASLGAKLRGLVARPVLRRLKAKVDPRHYNGAVFAGLNGVVVKSHGSADAIAFRHAIDTAVLECRGEQAKHAATTEHR
ncbi:MAG: phosphate acyltransferase PlsX [Pseudomonadota bacterium]